MKRERLCLACSVPKRAAEYTASDFNAPDGQLDMCAQHAQWLDNEFTGSRRQPKPGWIRRIMRAT